jgi:hypothetical protein
MSVRLCQNLSAKYALGISSKKDAKNQSPVYIQSWVAVVFPKVRKYIDKRGIKFLLWENKNIPNLVCNESKFCNIMNNNEISLNNYTKKNEK